METIEEFSRRHDKRAFYKIMLMISANGAMIYADKAIAIH